MAAAHAPGPLLGIGSNGFAPPPGRYVYAHYPGALPGQADTGAGELLAAHPAKARIYAICDNARSYKNKELREWLAAKPLCQVFLPPYSPKLNLMERFWKFLRQKLINPTFYRPEGQFRPAVLDFFTRLPEFGHGLAALLTRKSPILDAQPSS